MKYSIKKELFCKEVQAPLYVPFYFHNHTDHLSITVNIKPAVAALGCWLMIASRTANGNPPPPKIYTVRSEYETALKEYQEKKESHSNYRRKIDFFSSFKYPAARAGSISADQLKEEIITIPLTNAGIYLDNYRIRFRPSALPDGIVYINFLLIPGEEFLVISVDEASNPAAIFSAETYRFNDPGETPVWQENPLSVDPTVSTRHPDISDHTYDGDYFILPNGCKYTRIDLLRKLPSFTYDQVLVKNFPNTSK